MGLLNKQQKKTREHEEEKYKFMREQVRPQKKKIIIRFFKNIVMIIMAAIIFGGISGLVFYSFVSRIKEDANGDSVPEVTPYHTPPLRENTNTTGGTKADEDDGTIEDKNKASKNLSKIGEEYKWAVVRISNKGKRTIWYYISDDSEEAVSGVIYKKTGGYYYIIASNNFADDGTVLVEFYDSKTVEAEVVATDGNIGMAILRVNVSDVNSDLRKNIVIPQFGSTANVPLGSYVVAIGAPNGVMHTIMTGNIIKSAIKVPITDNEVTLFSTDILYADNASGVVLNTKGCIIGFINNSFINITGRYNMGFIGITGITDIIGTMARGESTAYLGIEGCDVDEELADEHNIEEGIYITSVYSNSPAYNGGMRIADVLTEIDGKEVSSLYTLHVILKGYKKGDEINVVISRTVNKKRMSKKLKVKLN